MHSIDNLHRWLVRQPLLWSFSTMTRLALALAFLPSGTTKLLGRPFTQIDPETSRIGYFFDGFLQSGAYYSFVGLCQVLAALLLLVPRTSFLGAVLYLPVIANIFVITVALDFQGTWNITLLMLLANLYLLFWDWERVRAALFPNAEPLRPDHRPVYATLPCGSPWSVRLATAGVCLFSVALFLFADAKEMPGLAYVAMALGLLCGPLAAAAWWRGFTVRA
jgi:uncharacterized membrane protein YphA (DoxX/SURF4 family)